jgi:hypothetical protein
MKNDLALFGTAPFSSAAIFTSQTGTPLQTLASKERWS